MMRILYLSSILGCESQSAAYNACLSRFQQAISINSTTSSHNDLELMSRSENGIYKETIYAQQWWRLGYLFVEVIFCPAPLANIVISATLTSLGPLSHLHPTTITVLGIANSSCVLLLSPRLGIPKPHCAVKRT
jgi:hypothetical protein